jgi:mono/diheme cytochrome c family protein
MICKTGRIFRSMIAAVSVTMLSTTLACADPANGEHLARQWCAACHVVAPDQKQANADVPTFAAIAKLPGFSRDKIAYFLLDPHPKMPNMSLTRAEAGDLADYIDTLGPPAPSK